MTGGLINFLAGNLGTGTIVLDGGGLQWARGNTSDISAQLAAIGAHFLVARDPAYRSSASIFAARAAPSASTGLKAAGRASSTVMASAIASGVAVAKSMRRPAA